MFHTHLLAIRSGSVVRPNGGRIGPLLFGAAAMLSLDVAFGSHLFSPRRPKQILRFHASGEYRLFSPLALHFTRQVRNLTVDLSVCRVPKPQGLNDDQRSDAQPLAVGVVCGAASHSHPPARGGRCLHSQDRWF